ncbi:MAG: pilus assembly protein CpaB [Thermosediminibacterales bacterium]|nr:pilus assembly protein CpaB [Thermosediminibacterales bacterium]MDK2835970.1 pilus assembly protein CpaB [Thermosediminibacterales bacterium]
MSKIRFLKMILLPLVIALMVTGSVYYYIETVESNKVHEDEFIEAVVAARGIPAKTVLSEEMLELKKIPKKLYDANSLVKLKEAVGEITTVPLAKGEIILKSKLAVNKEKLGLSYKIPGNLRAVTIGINEVTGVNNHVEPGDFVDILATFSEDIAGTEKTRLILENLLVLDASRESGKTLTLAVTPRQAAVLTFAEERGTIRAALRPVVGARDVGSVEVTKEDFQNKATPDYHWKEQLRLQITVIEADPDVLRGLNINQTEQVAFHELPKDLMEELLAGIEQKKAKILDQADLTTLEGEEAVYALEEKIPLYDYFEGERFLNWYNYGIRLNINPTVYKNPVLDITIVPKAQIVELAEDKDKATPHVLIREARSVERINVTEMVIISGLLRPKDFMMPNNGVTRYIIPKQQITDELKEGKRELIIVLYPLLDRR